MNEIDNRDKVLEENLKRTRFACQIEEARCKLRESELTVQATKPIKTIDLNKSEKTVDKPKRENDNSVSLFSQKTIKKFAPELMKKRVEEPTNKENVGKER